MFIRPSDKNLYYMGRIDFSDPERVKFFYSGSYVRMNFKGTGVKALNTATVKLLLILQKI